MLAIVVLTVLALAALYFRRAPVEKSSSVRFFISPPEKTTIAGAAGEGHFLAVSPDGHQVAFIATSEGQRRLWNRPPLSGSLAFSVDIFQTTYA